MKTLKNTFPCRPKTLSLLFMTLLASPLALAAEDGWYVGGSVGQTHENMDFYPAIKGLFPTNITPTGFSDGDGDTSYKLFGGYQFNQNFSIESGFFDLGDYNYSAFTNPDGPGYATYDIDGWFIDLVGTLPLTQKLDLLGRVGLNYADATTTIGGNGIITAPGYTNDSSGNNPKFGIGLQYAMTDNLGLRLEAERFRLDVPVRDTGYITAYSIGAVYHFGRKAEVVTVAAPAPAVVAARPTPPAPAPAPAPVLPMRVVFSADSVFGFDESVVTATGKRELDKFIADVKDLTYDIIAVTGHTDRIGAKPYNLALSQRRADAVKAYLVQTGKLPAAKITARGVNGDNPVIGANECRNTANTAALIVCLQPDRRVEVEVTATK